MRVIDAHMHYGTDRTVAAHTCVPYLVNGDPESVIRLLDEQGASHGVLFPHDRRMTPPGTPTTTRRIQPWRGGTTVSRSHRRCRPHRPDLRSAAHG